jgi:hypothetical protein
MQVFRGETAVALCLSRLCDRFSCIVMTDMLSPQHKLLLTQIEVACVKLTPHSKCRHNIVCAFWQGTQLFTYSLVLGVSDGIQGMTLLCIWLLRSHIRPPEHTDACARGSNDAC